MSRFFSEKYATLIPYTPGEQPTDQKYIKLNTNESPYPPSPLAQSLARAELNRLQLYSDPECRELIKKAAEILHVKEDMLIFTNGSDEILQFAFMAFCDDTHRAVFPDITYGFYPVFARLNGIGFETLPLNEDFTINVEEYLGIGKTIFLANPNAPTGIALPLSDIERIVKTNPYNVVVIDEAYVDFGGESAVSLIEKYDNLLVTRTFSKSYSLAGARLGYGIASPSIIRDLNTIRYSTNPYNVNRMTMAAGIGALQDREYFENNCRSIIENRTCTVRALCEMGFACLASSANFVFAKHKTMGGEAIYTGLKERGVLVRHFDSERLRDYNRITIGSADEMRVLMEKIKEILEA